MDKPPNQEEFRSWCERGQTKTTRLDTPDSVYSRNSENTGSDTKYSLSESSNSSSDSPISLTTPRLVLRPSSLAVQAEKFKISSTLETAKPNIISKSFASKNSDSVEAEDLVSSTSVLEADVIPTSISTSPDSKALNSSQPSTTSESSFGLFSVNSAEAQSNVGTFVFGQNLHERALNYESLKVEKSPVIEVPDSLTFESLQKDTEETKENERTVSLKRTLSDAAKEYESKKVKTVLEKVSVVTGEEDESNVLQINCRLFAFDNENKNWQERSRGVLRLNDREIEGTMQSRLVIRTQGSLRVVLNTKIWSGMTVEHPNEKTIRLTAIDSDGIKVFLVMTSSKDAGLLYNALKCRVATLKSFSHQSNKICGVNESSVDESASLSSTFDISSSDSFQDFSKQNFRNIPANVSLEENSAHALKALGKDEHSEDSVV